MDRADAFIDRFRATCDSLDSFPEMGKSRANLAPNLRSIVEGNYLIFYRPTSSGVEIVRVLHGARNLEALLGESLTRFRQSRNLSMTTLILFGRTRAKTDPRCVARCRGADKNACKQAMRVLQRSRF
jgi:toxin ParE1/3/4